VRASTQDGFATAADTPVIVLSAAASELARVRLLERGADDVIATPFSYLELRARIAAVLRRTAPRRPQAVLNAGPLRVDVHQRTVRVGQRPVQLSAVEYRLLCQLASEPSRVFTRAELLRDVWGFQAPARTRTVDSHASRLRRKLTQAGGTGLVSNVWGDWLPAGVPGPSRDRRTGRPACHGGNERLPGGVTDNPSHRGHAGTPVKRLEARSPVRARVRRE